MLPDVDFNALSYEDGRSLVKQAAIEKEAVPEWLSNIGSGIAENARGVGDMASRAGNYLADTGREWASEAKQLGSNMYGLGQEWANKLPGELERLYAEHPELFMAGAGALGGAGLGGVSSLWQPRGRRNVLGRALTGGLVGGVLGGGAGVLRGYQKSRESEPYENRLQDLAEEQGVLQNIEKGKVRNTSKPYEAQTVAEKIKARDPSVITDAFSDTEGLGANTDTLLRAGGAAAPWVADAALQKVPGVRRAGVYEQLAKPEGRQHPGLAKHETNLNAIREKLEGTTRSPQHRAQVLQELTGGKPDLATRTDKLLGKAMPEDAKLRQWLRNRSETERLSKLVEQRGGEGAYKDIHERHRSELGSQASRASAKADAAVKALANAESQLVGLRAQRDQARGGPGGPSAEAIAKLEDRVEKLKKTVPKRKDVATQRQKRHGDVKPWGGEKGEQSRVRPAKKGEPRTPSLRPGDAKRLRRPRGRVARGLKGGLSTAGFFLPEIISTVRKGATGEASAAEQLAAKMRAERIAANQAEQEALQEQLKLLNQQ